ncbi:unnamed protein product [Linum tenue]|uniref:Uncharacterized protein n=1 Tax=Linum tenue TaxID=586396 RepID=A0AAV0KZX3_9ROSI|nr:unnamed protein product [Linum tenue]
MLWKGRGIHLLPTNPSLPPTNLARPLNPSHQRNLRHLSLVSVLTAFTASVVDTASAAWLILSKCQSHFIGQVSAFCCDVRWFLYSKESGSGAGERGFHRSRDLALKGGEKISLAW